MKAASPFQGGLFSASDLKLDFQALEQRQICLTMLRNTVSDILKCALEALDEYAHLALAPCALLPCLCQMHFSPVPRTAGLWRVMSFINPVFVRVMRVL